MKRFEKCNRTDEKVDGKFKNFARKYVKKARGAEKRGEIGYLR